MADAAVGNQAFDIVLSAGQPRAVQNARNTQPHGDGSKADCSLWKEHEVKADHAIAPGFEHKAREENTGGSRGLRVGGGQPDMHGDDRKFHCKRNKEPQHKQHGKEGRRGVLASAK